MYDSIKDFFDAYQKKGQLTSLIKNRYHYKNQANTYQQIKIHVRKTPYPTNINRQICSSNFKAYRLFFYDYCGFALDWNSWVHTH